jgi:hypothetical protein
VATLKPHQVAAAALLGGFPPSQVPTAVAVAKGESSYRTTARNSCCSGLWQIHRTAHADKIAAAGGVEKLTDPVVNARLAHQIWAAAGGWCTTGRIGQCNPWQAYGVGAWKSKVAEGTRAYAEVQQRQARGESLAAMVGTSADAGAINAGFPNPFGEALDTAQAIAASGRSLVEFGNRIGRWTSDPDSWVRVAKVVGGGMLIVVGLRIAFNTQVMSVVRKAASVVGPGGKVAKVASAAKGAGVRP